MSNNNKNETITINRNELKTEIRSVFGEVIGESIKNIGELLITAICGGNFSAVHKPQAETEQAADYSETPPVDESSEPVAEETPIPEKSEMMKIITGYIYLTLDEMGYSRKDISLIIQRLEKKINCNDYETAYKQAESALMPLVVLTLIIPAEYYDLKISALKYSNNIVGTRIANALKNLEIEYIKDFRDKPDLARSLNGVSRFGKGMQAEFLTALKRSIGSTPIDETPIDEPPKDENIPVSTVAKIAGIEIPAKFHGWKVEQLAFTSNVSKAKLCKKLKNKGITHIKDFFKPENSKISSLGFSANGVKSFKETIKRTIAN